MARRRKSRKRRVVRSRNFGAAKRRTRRKSSSKFKVLGVDLLKVGAAVAYGAVRERASNAVRPLTSQIPLIGNLGDEVSMLILAGVTKKFVGNKVPFIGKIADSAMIIEGSRIGSNLLSGSLLGAGPTETTTNSFR